MEHVSDFFKPRKKIDNNYLKKEQYYSTTTH